MIRRAFTLIEIIITIAITGILSVGMFKAFEAITLRSEKAKILTTLSIDSQTALDQISILLYDRAPMSVQGCDTNGHCEPLDGTLYTKTLLKWNGLASESYLAGDYSSFVDMNRSNYATATLYTPDTSKTAIENTQTAKWGSFNWANNDIALVFSGSFDEGNANVYPISMTSDNTIVFNVTPPTTIYEKYNLVDTGYAVVRGEHLPVKNATCITALGISNAALDNTLFLFDDYRPWKGESFCADTANQAGKVSILSTNVNAFRAQMINGTIRLAIDTNRSVRGGNLVRLSKQKVVF
ncbi:prepilin-type N-terminal cleavage/methylation domain-containing protein [Sulfuricurvum sp.]|uniref:prepilin-type N-terminal cleavage/methylation domain-containing protein n=1 Tax=Sulfuricurvum sp. TaxID=2025608 RepID=UPI00261AF15E|nr:prepilin-type N-terminal cleavage/methylation domain-containing protein [Sulfuricurvum sp.]MDD2265921.1 prepilin-type N-terminal cleavage/methylation domain-containing protein [Sulfuricurvum sp.]MDD2782923.1 prepilin-type N-terminal cleavage/methylation domain-containing protein [Sulfuricurvum sp.]